jgi:hypothetical protein
VGQQWEGLLTWGRGLPWLTPMLEPQARGEVQAQAQGLMLVLLLLL